MRLTRLGLSVLAADAFAFFGGLISGNNLLYLVAGSLAASLAMAWLAGRRHPDSLELRFDIPAQIFQGQAFRLSVEIRNPKRSPVFPATLAGPRGRAEIPYLPGGEAARVEIPYLAPRRGINRVEDLHLESCHPFGFFLRRRKVPDVALTAFPAVREVFGRTSSAAVREDRVSLPRRGVGDELHGIRDYVPGEDSRLINWKLTAKTGKPLVKEYAQTIGNRITVRADGTPGPGTEDRLSEAASLIKFFIDSGAEVRLETNEGDIAYGHGLLHLQILLQNLALLGEGKEPRGTPASSFRQRRLPLAPSRAVRLPLLAVTAAAFGSLFLIEELDPVFVALAALIIPLGWLFDRTGIHPIPRAVFDAGALVVFVLAFFVDLPLSGLVPTVTHILLYVLTSYLWSPKNEPVLKRILLADFLLFFLASGQAVDFGYFPVFVLFFLTAAVFLARFSDPDPRPLRRPGWRRAVLTVGVRTLFLAAALFIILPRAYSPRMQQLLASTGLSRFQNPLMSFAGLSDRVDLGFFGPLRKNSARVLRLSFPDAPGGTPPSPVLHVRAAAFDDFVGRRWVRTTGDFAVRDGDRPIMSRDGVFRLRGRRGRILFPGFDPEKPVLTQEFFVFPLIGSFVFSVGGIAALETDSYSASFDLNDSVGFPYLYNSPTRYRVLSQSAGPDFYRGIEGYDALLRDKFLKLNSNNPRWLASAKELTNRFPSPFGKARALEADFRTRYSYSLTSADNRQDLERFLWTSRAGNCEYFATAMVLLLRHLGIPSRLVVGFLAAEWNEFGRFLDVRQSDAHAWVEAFFPDRGWTTFDPTPPDRTGGEKSIFAAIWRRFRKGLNAIESRWYRYVVGFDSETQKDFFHRLRFAVGRNTFFMGFIILAALAAIIAAVVLKPRRRWRTWKARRARADHFYYAVLDRLERRRIGRSPSLTAREFAAEVVRRRPDLAPFRTLTGLFEAARYGGVELSGEKAAQARELSGRLLHALRRRPGKSVRETSC
jgi:uncharacterized protein (DUF58 family)